MSLTKQQLEDRKHSIGGSDLSAVMGHNPWKSPVQVWQEKSTGESVFIENEAMRMGHVMEPVIADLFIEKHPTFTVEEPGEETYFHPDHPYLIAHPDRLILDESGSLGVLEIKNSRHGWTHLPEYYELQMRHYMCVMDLDYAYCAALFGGSEYWECKIERNKLIEQVLIKHCRLFMLAVSTGECAADPSTLDDVAILFPLADKKLTMELTDKDSNGLLRLIRGVSFRASKIKELEEEVSRFKAEIGNKMGEHYNIKYNGKVVVSYPTIKGRKSLDKDALIQAHPEIVVDSFMKQGKDYRRMTVKEIGDA